MHTFFSLFLLFTTTTASLSSQHHFLRPRSLSLHHSSNPQEYIELTQPLPSDHLTPSYTHTILRHSFANTINSPPFSIPYSPPPPSDCPSPWSHVSLEFSSTCKGDQYDRISALWLAGSEILRTSTAEPTQSGIFWKLRKDVTKYSSLFTQSNLNLTMMLENVVNDVYTGVYHVEIKLLFYNDSTRVNLIDHLSMKPDLVNTEPPPDLIIPISDDSGGRGFWFRIESESDSKLKRIQIPRNTRKLVMELYVSFHGNDEFWYANPPDSYIRANNLTTNRGNGAYREVTVSIDGQFVGSEVPFPVVFGGGINPLLWEPVVAIGAFSLPSYDLDLSPFLGLLVDGKDHSFGIGINNGISYWLVDANLHLWLDHKSSKVEAKSFLSEESPTFSINREEKFRMLDGSFKIKAKRDSEFVGWVKSSIGNMTTVVSREFKFENSIRFENDGDFKLVKQNVKAKREVKVKSDGDKVMSRIVVNRRYPINVITSTLAGKYKDTYLLETNVTHGLNERYRNGEFVSVVNNTQDSRGWMEVRDHDVIDGDASTKQSFRYRDDLMCYLRTVAATNGSLISDNSSFSCPSLM